MQSIKTDRISRLGYAFLLTAALLIPGVSSAAILTGSTSVNTVLGDITVAVEVDDGTTTISLVWPLNHWLGISFGPTPAHDFGYMIVSPLDSDVNPPYEANAQLRTAPEIQSQQDLNFVSFDTSNGVSELLLTRASDTGDPLDFQFVGTNIENPIPMLWALGPAGAPTTDGHLRTTRGEFGSDLELVPVPAAVWLFGSGLLGLIGIARRRSR